MKLAIITDSGCNYYQEKHEIDHPDVYVVPLQVVDGDKGYRDGVETNPKHTYDLIKQGKLLKTSSPLMSDIEHMMQSLVEKGVTHVLSIPITAGLSSTSNAFDLVAKQHNLEITHVDCKATARIQYECVMSAQKMIQEGKTIEQIVSVLDQMIKQSCTFVLPVDMKHLSRSGRLTPMAATLASFLKISPILYLDTTTNGKIEQYKKVRTLKKAFSTVIDHFVEAGVDSSYKVCITHVNAIESGEEFMEMLQEKIPNADISFVDLVSVVGVHTGLGCVACQYIKKYGGQV